MPEDVQINTAGAKRARRALALFATREHLRALQIRRYAAYVLPTAALLVKLAPMGIDMSSEAEMTASCVSFGLGSLWIGSWCHVYATRAFSLQCIRSYWLFARRHDKPGTDFGPVQVVAVDDRNSGSREAAEGLDGLLVSP